MRIFALGLLLTITLVSVASAELLVTANPFGKGKFVVEGAYVGASNVSNSSMTSAGLGGYVGYGVNEKLDLIVNAGTQTLASLALGVTGISGNSYGLSAKYLVAAEGKDLPVSVAVGAGYKILSQKVDIIGSSTTTNGNQALVGVGVSKVMAPFVPYGGLTYRSTSLGGNMSQIDATVGSMIGFSKQGGVLVEYTIQSITASGTSYSSGQFAIGVGYAL